MGLQFEVNIPSGATVQAGHALVHTALLILLVNAVKYNEPGGRIQVRLATKEHRMETARSRNVDGIGLGLSLAREIIRAHGGELTLEESRAGQTRFRAAL